MELKIDLSTIPVTSTDPNQITLRDIIAIMMAQADPMNMRIGAIDAYTYADRFLSNRTK